MSSLGKTLWLINFNPIRTRSADIFKTCMKGNLLYKNLLRGEAYKPND